jgi:ribonuclease BN (tRNA processing enzyme)
MNDFHTSTEQLAGVLKKVNPKLTVLYHYVTFTPANATDQERGVKEIKKFGYNGIVISVTGRRHLLGVLRCHSKLVVFFDLKGLANEM